MSDIHDVVLYMYCDVWQKLHDKLMVSVLAATCSWFDSTPVGRITNRFSSDIDSVDQEMMMSLRSFIDCCLGTVQVFLAIGKMSFPPCM